MQLDKIEYINRVCAKLKILQLQDNCIETIENLGRMKSLEYLNLAMNNIERIQNLDKLESLNKLDLTLNFIGKCITCHLTYFCKTVLSNLLTQVS